MKGLSQKLGKRHMVLVRGVDICLATQKIFSERFETPRISLVLKTGQKAHGISEGDRCLPRDAEDILRAF